MKFILFPIVIIFNIPLLANSISPVQISFFPPLQLVSSDSTIVGFRYNLFYGKNKSVWGLDTGLVNYVENSSGGVSAGVANFSKTHLGFQLGAGNYAEDIYGSQIGFINVTGHPLALQMGAINVITGKSYLPMLGILVNWSDTPYLGQYSLGFNQANKAPLQITGILSNSSSSLLQITGGLNFSDSGILQISGLSNSGKTNSIQLALGGNFSVNTYFQFGSLNLSQKSFWQLGIFGASSKENILQTSVLFNYSMSGKFQFTLLGNFGKKENIQFAGVTNYQSTDSEESVNFQITPVFNYSDQSNYQIASINYSHNSQKQIGLINLSENSNQIQFGFFNRSIKTNHFMFGIINESHELMGVQIGLINIAKNASIPFTFFYNSNFEKREIRNSDGIIDTNWTPIQLSFYYPIQLFTYNTEIKGIRINLFQAKSKTVYGVDFGLLNRSENSRGLSIGAVHLVKNEFIGIQTGIFNYVQEDVKGAQIGILNLNQKSILGLGIGFVQITNQDVKGIQIGILGNAGSKVYSPQIGLGVNFAKSTPFQISGIGNYFEENQEGFQITGGVNYAKKNTNTQIAGIANFTDSDITLGQISLLYNSSDFTPLQISGFGNYARRESYVQLAGIFNMVTRDIRSAPFGAGMDPFVQASLFFNLSRKTYFQISSFNIDNGDNFSQVGIFNLANKGTIQTGGLNICFQMEGVQLGLINAGGGLGFQTGIVNLNGKYSGASMGLWNMTGEQKGVSLGIFNFAEKLNGIQIGLLNIHLKGNLPIMLGFNWGSKNDSDTQ
jgi:hypothetical protein